MPEIRGNSHKEREAKKDTTPKSKQVVSSEDLVTVSQAKSDWREFLDLFLPADPRALKRGLMERIADSFKALASDAFNYILYPGSWGSRPNQPTNVVSGPYWRGSSAPTNVTQMPAVTTPRNDFCEARVRTFDAAMAILKECTEVRNRYGMVRVMDFNNAAGLPTVSTDHDWGWKDVTKFNTVRNLDGTWSVIAPHPYELTE